MILDRHGLASSPRFFTVNLAERSSRLLVDRVDDLREIVRDVREAYPFEIVAW
ncbi:MAG TPA: transposase, partial [Chromatiaceae bacterium]|nr:transposase [Chromatiaceae bacterium]